MSSPAGRPASGIRLEAGRGQPASTANMLAVLASAGTALLLGLVTVSGWHLEAGSVVQPFAGFSPIQYNVGLAFFGSGLALLLCLRRAHLAATVAAATAGALGALTGLQYLLGVDLGIDQALFEHPITAGTSHPGRMAPSAALGFVLAAGATLILARAAVSSRLAAVAGLLATVVLTVGAVSLVGYAMGLRPAYAWGNFTRISVLAAAGFVALAPGLFLLAAVRDPERGVASVSWVPAAAAGGLSAAALALALALEAEQRAALRQVVRIESGYAAARVRQSLQDRLETFQRMARRWSLDGGTPAAGWRDDARRHVEELPGTLAISWSDPGGEIRWLTPDSPKGRLETLRLHTREGPDLASAPGVTTAAGTQAATFALHVPVAEAGMLTALHDAAAFFDAALDTRAERRLHVSVRDTSGTELYRTDNQSAAGSLTEFHTVPLVDHSWQLGASPAVSFLDARRSWLPGTVVASGLALAMLVALCLRLLRLTQQQRTALAEANAQLEQRIFRRTRALEQARSELEQAYQTERHARETLERHDRLQAAVAELGMAALRGGGDLALMERAVTVASSALQVEYAKVLELRPPGDRLHLIAGVGWREGLIGVATLDTGANSQGGYALSVEQPVVVEDLATDQRFNAPPLLVEHGVVSGMSAIIHGAAGPWGVLGMHTRQRRRFDHSDVAFLQSVANLIGYAIQGRQAAEEIRLLNEELEERVRRRTEELEAANRELESFSYSVSHDLRSPLRAIDGFADVLIEDQSERLDGEGRRVLGIIQKNVAKMGRLIDELLQFSRLSRAELVTVPVDMTALACEVTDELLEQEAHRAIRIDVASLPAVPGDPTLLRQVWVNLLDNACKYSRGRDPARIEVTGGADGDGMLRYTVKDNGVGFDMAYAEKLFGVFQRLHRDSEFEGTGVGLALVQRIVARHGGRASGAGSPGDGAEFSFMLPAGG